MRTPHAVLSLRSTRWRERSVDERSTSPDGRRRSSAVLQSVTATPRPLRRTSCDGHRARTLPASFRVRCQSVGATPVDETVGLEPIGRGVETLECEPCYLAASAHLRHSSAAAAARPHTTLPATDVDSIAPRLQSTRHPGPHDFGGTARLERVGSASTRQRENLSKDSATTMILPKIANKPSLLGDSVRSDRLPSLYSRNHGISLRRRKYSYVDVYVLKLVSVLTH